MTTRLLLNNSPGSLLAGHGIRELARMSGLHPATVSAAMGHRTSPSPRVVQFLALTFPEASLADLLILERPPEPEPTPEPPEPVWIATSNGGIKKKKGKKKAKRR